VRAAKCEREDNLRSYIGHGQARRASEEPQHQSFGESLPDQTKSWCAQRDAQRSIHEGSSVPQKSLIVLQAALSLVLLAGAGLLTESLRNLESQQFGFETDGRLIVKVDPGLAGYTADRLDGLYRTLRERLGQIPEVESVSLSL